MTFIDNAFSSNMIEKLKDEKKNGVALDNLTTLLTCCLCTKDKLCD